MTRLVSAFGRARTSRPTAEVAGGWRVGVATAAQARIWMRWAGLPRMIGKTGPEKRTVEPSTEPALGFACGFIRWCSPNLDRTNAERPAIRELKVADAAPA